MWPINYLNNTSLWQGAIQNPIYWVNLAFFRYANLLFTKSVENEEEEGEEEKEEDK